MIKFHINSFILTLCVLLAGCNSAALTNLEKLKAPAGFKIELFADNLTNARTMVLGDEGTLFVGTRTVGNIYAVKDGNQYTIASNLNMPNGIAFHNKALYVADVDKLYRYDNIEAAIEADPTNIPDPVLIRDDFPDDAQHGWRYIGFGPDDRLYMAIGAPCNVCLEEDYALIISMQADGTDQQVVAKGIRNTVGFNWHPDTQKLWMSENGRDRMGDDIPPDELNRVDMQGEHFGFPYCHGESVPDPEFDAFSCADFSPPAGKLGAHVAPLGIEFYTGGMFPASYKNKLFVAEHGSWNRSSKVGYKIGMATIEGETVTDYQPFVTGWLEGETAWGRPAYVLQLKDGSILISDDRAGSIFRVSYQP